ncbi:MAG: PVC-type heme-binding CxxCH protein [Planctomycetaceae bacterium]
MPGTRHFVRSLAVLLVVSVAGTGSPWVQAAKPALSLKRGDHISIIGNTLADRMQHHAWLETYLQALHPEHHLTIRNLGFSADEITVRPRSANFGSPDQWLTKTKADVVFCFFGYNEALRGEAGLPGFRKNLAAMIDGMRKQKYNGKSAPQLVLFSPIAHENLHNPNLPDGSENNKKLALYAQAMQQVCKAAHVRFVDLFHPTQQLYANAKKPLTVNGIHLLERGNRALARVIAQRLFPDKIAGRKYLGITKLTEKGLENLRSAILDKNLHWFSRYRVVDGYNVYGDRSKLAWFGVSNADVMKREMEMFDVMTANRDRRVWAVAGGSDLKVVDNNLPKALVVKPNRDSKLKGDRYPYLTAQQSMAKMKLAPGMQVNLFASERMFPELVNPVQMAVDTDGRLFVSVWPSYPHWNPTQPRLDRILCLPDENGDGVADKCIIFADKLNSITSFEFWGGGMLVAAPPEIWFLKDSNGDGKADVKIRMLQGISSADTHHSANAMVVGPDGWLYWSRGIFNTASMETPTRTHRAGNRQTGVHRFNPRTFEVEFHFPIGPNPHGDVFDQWGYQFANDGTSGTGCYVNIGKGVRNKQWFKKRVRPVAATGILSSSHFPKHNNGNFLICNTIGFLGVLQHKINYNGADITATEIEPILVSSDANFRPTDLEIGGDGALYVSDWCNQLIGHMQHNMRDPNRDHAHGRIYRVTYKGRPLVKRVKMKGKPIAEVCRAFYAKENSTRYRARLELSGRKTADVTAAVSKWAGRLNPDKADDAQALLECLWVFEEHRVPNFDLLKRVLQAKEPRVRAAAIRTLGHWGEKVKNWQPTLTAASRDDSALVRAEAVKAAVSFDGLAAAEIIFEVAARPTDPELDFVLKYARGKLNVDQIVRDAVKSGKPLSTAAQSYVLRNATIKDLLKLKPTEAVQLAILSRRNATAKNLRDSLDRLAALRKESKLKLLLDLIKDRDGSQNAGLAGLGRLLAEQPPAELRTARSRIERLALSGKAAETRQWGYAAWIAANASADDAFLAASKSKNRLRDFLAAVPSVADRKLRGELYAKVRPLIFQLPRNLKTETGGSGFQKPGVTVDFFPRPGANVALETLAGMKPQSSRVVGAFDLKSVRRRRRRGAFALRFRGAIQIPRSGRYTFFSNSDDGSRLYIGGRLVVNNDGSHGPVERSGRIDLPAGSHPIVVTYSNTGGGSGLRVSWAGPGLRKQVIPGNRLTVGGGETLHDVAIRALASIPGHESEKVADLASLIKGGKSRAAAIAVLRGIPLKSWPQKAVRPLADNLVGYLSEMPARYRTGKPALETIALAKSLADRLPADHSKAILARLQNLDVRVIAIGTVPHRMIYDKEWIVVQAGRPVEFRFSNTDDMPHNFTITLPGAMAEIGNLAELTARDPDAIARQYVPKSAKIILASRLLQPGQSQALSFLVPKRPGIYPYVCTFPGHWRRMYGALYVVADPEAYRANPQSYLASHKLAVKDELLNLIGKSHDWKLAELLAFVKPLKPGRAFMVGKNAFTMANCVACHRLGGVGQQFGPDLTKLEPKKQNPEHILRSLIDPSKTIDEKYQSNVFQLESGKIVTGLVIEETAETVKVIENPLAKSKPFVIRKSDIEARKKLTKSIMPVGLASRLTREEILDLIAYVFARGDKKHKLFLKHKPE